MDAVATRPAGTYECHEPEQGLLYQVLPSVPIRQWVLSFPIEIRYRLAYDGDLLSQVLRPFMEHLNAFYRSQGRRDGRTGGIICVQRAGSSLNLDEQS